LYTAVVRNVFVPDMRQDTTELFTETQVTFYVTHTSFSEFSNCYYIRTGF